MLPPPGTIASWTPVDERRAPPPRSHDARRVGAVVEVAHQRLAGQLQQDAPEDRLRHRRLLADHEPREAPDHDVLAGRGGDLVLQLADRLAVVLVGVDVRLVEQHDLAVPLRELALGDLRADLSRPVGRLLLEDPQLRLARVRRARPRVLTQRGAAAATCEATSRANATKSSLRATKSVSQSTSTSAPTFALWCT